MAESRLMRGANIPQLMTLVGYTVISGYRRILELIETFYEEGTVLRSGLEWLAIIISGIICTMAVWQLITTIVWY